MAMLVALAALVYPALERPLAAERLRQAAQQVRAAWAHARVESMSSGLIQVFRYKPESSRYTVQAWEGDDAWLEVTGTSSSPGLSAAATGARASLYGTEVVAAGEESLPEDIIFAESDRAIDARAASVDAALARSDATPPILFYPDGTATSAILRLEYPEYEFIVELELRGLTGVVIITDVMGKEELK